MLPNDPRGGTIVTDVTQPDQRGPPEAARYRRPRRPPAHVTAPKPEVDPRAVIDHEIASRSSRPRTLSVHYSGKPAVLDVTLRVPQKQITAFIGPSGCGKSTILRCFEPHERPDPGGRRSAGTVRYHGLDLYGAGIDAVQVRKRIGMVFQKPNPFPKSIYDNIAFGPRILGMKGDMDEIVETRAARAPRCGTTSRTASRTTRSGCPAASSSASASRARWPTNPDVLLMDEPCSALDPISTGRIEDLMHELKETVSIVIVTHNMQQAARVSDRTAFFIVDLSAGEDSRIGRLVEYGPTQRMFTTPHDQRTEDYVSGKFG